MRRARRSLTRRTQRNAVEEFRIADRQTLESMARLKPVAKWVLLFRARAPARARNSNLQHKLTDGVLPPRTTANGSRIGFILTLGIHIASQFNRPTHATLLPNL